MMDGDGDGENNMRGIPCARNHVNYMNKSVIGALIRKIIMIH